MGKLFSSGNNAGRQVTKSEKRLNRVRYIENYRFTEEQLALADITRAPEGKSGWVLANMAADTDFLHGSGSDLTASGISRAYAGEYCFDFDDPHKAALGDMDGRFIFVFRNSQTDQYGHPKPAGAVGKGWGKGGFLYLVRVPQGTPYMSIGGAVTDRGEVGLMADIQPGWIVTTYRYQRRDEAGWKPYP